MRINFLTLIFLPVLIFSTASCDRAEKKREQQKAISELEKTTEDMRDSMRKELEEDGGVGFESGTKNLQKMSDHLGEMAANSTGQDAIAAEVAQQFMGRIAGLVEKMADSAEKLELSMDYQNVKSPEDFDKMTVYAKDYQAVNAEVKEQFETKIIKDLKEEAKAKGLKGKAYSNFFAGVNANYGRQLPHILEVRETDDRLCNAIIAQHKLLKDNWGQWHWSEEDDNVTFETDELVDDYNKIADDIQQIVEDQAEAQRKLLSNGS